MSCILYPMGAYLAIARAETFKAAHKAVAAADFHTPGHFARSLFELNAQAYQDRYGAGHGHETAGEIAEAREDTASDYEFDEYLTAEALEPGEAFAALRQILKRIDYQCADASDYETNVTAKAVERAIEWLAAQEVSPRGRELAEQRRRAEDEQRQADFERFVAELRAQYPWAKARSEKTSEYARAASNMKKELTKAFPGVKFSTRSESYSMGNSVTVSWTDGPAEKQVDEIAGKYSYGTFDSQTDCAGEDTSPYGRAVGEVLGRARHVSANRRYSAGLFERVCEDICTLAGVRFTGVNTQIGEQWNGFNDAASYAHNALGRCSFPVGATYAGVKYSDELTENGACGAREVYQIVLSTPEPKAPEPGGAESRVYKLGHKWAVKCIGGGEFPVVFATKAEALRMARANAEINGVGEPVETPSEVAADVTRDGEWTWISFPAKPPQTVIDRLKTAGARWSRKRSAWYFSRPVDMGELFPGSPAPTTQVEETTTAVEGFALACNDPVGPDGRDCGRTFTGETAEEAGAYLDAHKAIAHRAETKYALGAWAEGPLSSVTCDECGAIFRHKDAAFARTMRDAHKGLEHPPEPYIPDEHAATARVLAYRPRANFRYVPRDWPPDEPDPTGGEGVETAQDAPAAEGEAAEPPAPETAVESPQAQAGASVYVTADTLKALKLLKDATNLQEERAGEHGGDKRLLILTIGMRTSILNVERMAKWASLLPADCGRIAATFEPVGDGDFSVALEAGPSYIKFLPLVGRIPFAVSHIQLHLTESGEIVAPALPSPEEMKQARKALAEGRKALKAERMRQNMLRGVNSARADMRRAEEYTERLEEEARETLARAEELTEEDCEEAVTLAKRVRDLRRLRREVERAAEDPQVNTPEFFEWLTEEHRAAYAEAFPEYEKAERRGWHKKAAAARVRLARILNGAFREHVSADVADIDPVTVEEQGEGAAHSNVLGYTFRPEVQQIKRRLRELPGLILRKRERVERARAEYREQLEAFAPHLREEEREQYETLMKQFEPEPLRLAA